MKLSSVTRFAIITYQDHTQKKYPKEHTLQHSFVEREGTFRKGSFYLLIKP